MRKYEAQGGAKNYQRSHTKNFKEDRIFKNLVFTWAKILISYFTLNS